MNPDAPDVRWMQLALTLGRRGLGRVWPNPAVGCVLVKQGRAIGRGWTQDSGRPHAEAMALAQAGRAAQGATAYVTLEPCAHKGQTPPCASALIQAGVARVVTAIKDPDPRVCGRGIAMLREAGIAVKTGILAEEARADHAGFLSRVERGRPALTLKLALSIDGRIATATGESQWITGSAARRAVHAMRAQHDAVMVGAGTARADLPSLTVRDLGVSRQPVRVVLCRHLDVPRMGPLFETCRDVPVWLLHQADAPSDRQAAWSEAGAKLIPYDGTLPDALQRLGEAGVTRVFCEGGGQLAANLLDHDLVDRLCIFHAGIALGAEGLSGVGPMSDLPLADRSRYRLVSQNRIGADTVQIWQPN